MVTAVLAAAFQAGIIVPPACGQKLDVSHHIDSKIAEAEAQAIFAQGSLILQTKDGPDDVACNVTLSLAPPVTTFGQPAPSEIYNNDDFRAVCARPGYVHVVNVIQDCGGLSIPGMAGCSDTPGSCIVVIRLVNPVPADKEGMLWAHEYGHTKGLTHRPDQNALMNSFLGTTERRVNKTECQAFSGHAQGGKAPNRGPQPGIVDFVHRDYVEGIPFEIASSYSPADAQKLIALLKEPSERAYLTNIVVTLGMIGDPATVSALKSFVEEGEGPIEADTLRAKVSAMTALGYAVNRHRDDSAFAYLAHGLNPKTWKEKNLKWVLRGSENSEQRTISLVKASALGLGISGTPEAATALNSAQFTIESVDPQASAAVSPVIQHALNLNKAIQQKGLLLYYREKQL